jgi:hypothetical protein
MSQELIIVEGYHAKVEDSSASPGNCTYMLT